MPPIKSKVAIYFFSCPIYTWLWQIGSIRKFGCIFVWLQRCSWEVHNLIHGPCGYAFSQLGPRVKEVYSVWMKQKSRHHSSVTMVGVSQSKWTREKTKVGIAEAAPGRRAVRTSDENEEYSRARKSQVSLSSATEGQEQVEKMGGELRKGVHSTPGSGGMLSKVGGQLPPLLPLLLPLWATHTLRGTVLLNARARIASLEQERLPGIGYAQSLEEKQERQQRKGWELLLWPHPQLPRKRDLGMRLVLS